MTHLEQLEAWQRGVAIHQVSNGGQCCPDFSCCRPELLAPQDVRDVFVEAYKQGHEDGTTRVLMTFLGNAFAESNIYIAGQEASRREIAPPP